VGWEGQYGRRTSSTDSVGSGSGLLCPDHTAAKPDAFGDEQ
jgi:hypothetical protein